MECFIARLEAVHQPHYVRIPRSACNSLRQLPAWLMHHTLAPQLPAVCEGVGVCAGIPSWCAARWAVVLLLRHV